MRNVPAPLMDRLLEEATKHLEANDRRADPLFFLLREMDPKSLRDNLAKKAETLRKKKDYARALLFLPSWVAIPPARRDSLRGGSLRTQAVGSGAGRGTSRKDPCLHDLARLIHSHDQPPLERLRTAKWLVPEELFYLGFHFAESSNRQEREFGGALLELVQTRRRQNKARQGRQEQAAHPGLIVTLHRQIRQPGWRACM